MLKLNLFIKMILNTPLKLDIELSQIKFHFFLHFLLVLFEFGSLKLLDGFFMGLTGD